MFQLTLLLLLTILSCLTAAAQSTFDACTNLKTTLSLENTTILIAERLTKGQTISQPASCRSEIIVTTDACRIYAVVNTTAESAVHFEMWLPDVWFGRFLAVGNGGLAGCIDYFDLGYGNTLHFATIASDNGHEGPSGAPFLNKPEVINDFAFRAIHVEAVLGKQILNAYYHRAHDKSYFLGCSTGGRQGMQSALLYPDDFDGILSGAPATDFNRLLGWSGMIGRYLGAPNPDTSHSFIPAGLWPVISAEILKQCDHLDGLTDGLISEPDDCVFDPEALLCRATVLPDEGGRVVDFFGVAGKLEWINTVIKTMYLRRMAVSRILRPLFLYAGISQEPNEHSKLKFPDPVNPGEKSGLKYHRENQVTFVRRNQGVFRGDWNNDKSNCLTAPQVDALKKIYSPLVGTRGEPIYPRFDPGAEGYDSFVDVFTGTISPITTDWYRYVVYNDSGYSFDNFSVSDIEFANAINPGGIATWDGNLSEFQQRGGKLITYHGRSDPLIPSGNSKRLYNLIASTLSQPSLDDFYRLFLIPGMGHCIGGPGASAFGQTTLSSNLVNDSAHNVLLALVEWVEEQNPPEVIVGTTWLVEGNSTREQRVHCRYPQRSVFNGTSFVCEG